MNKQAAGTNILDSSAWLIETKIFVSYSVRSWSKQQNIFIYTLLLMLFQYSFILEANTYLTRER